jgi:hypothetical protein
MPDCMTEVASVEEDTLLGLSFGRSCCTKFRRAFALAAPSCKHIRTCGNRNWRTPPLPQCVRVFSHVLSHAARNVAKLFTLDESAGRHAGKLAGIKGKVNTIAATSGIKWNDTVRNLVPSCNRSTFRCVGWRNLKPPPRQAHYTAQCYA